MQNWKMFKESLRLMIPWLQIYEKIPYGKWLSEYCTEMSTLPENSLMEGIFAQSFTVRVFQYMFGSK